MKVNRHSCVYIYKLSIDIKQYIYIYILNCYKNRFFCFFQLLQKREKKSYPKRKNKKETTVVCVSIYIYFFIIIYYLKYGNFDSTKCIGKISK